MIPKLPERKGKKNATATSEANAADDGPSLEVWHSLFWDRLAYSKVDK